MTLAAPKENLWANWGSSWPNFLAHSWTFTGNQWSAIGHLHWSLGPSQAAALHSSPSLRSTSRPWSCSMRGFARGGIQKDHQWPPMTIIHIISHPNPKRCFWGLMIIHDGIWWPYMAILGHTGTMKPENHDGQMKNKQTLQNPLLPNFDIPSLMMFYVTCSLIFQIPPATASSSMGKNRSCQGFALGNWKYLGDRARK